MSTFKGLLVDFPLRFIAIDHFGEHTYDCDIFFLSHHHCDHMVGLYDEKFANLINQSDDKFIYCSPVTAHFLSKNYLCRNIRHKINALDIYKPLVIQHEFVDTDVVVTCLPAGHCPGSVMFLIEYKGKRILYSGDIRITVRDLKKMRGGLTNADGSLIEIDDLYLDTTWAICSRFDDIPTREESENTIIDFISKSISSLPDGKVLLSLPSKFGYEALYLNIFKKFKKPVILHDRHYEYYQNVEEMSHVVKPTSQCVNNEWIVHACCGSKCNIDVKYVKKIRPCALAFVHGFIKEFEVHEMYKVPYESTSAVTRVMYSCHSSLSELRDIYQFLKPKMMYPSVSTKGYTLYEIARKIKTAEMSSENDCSHEQKRGLSVKPSNPKRSREENELRRIEARKKLKLN